MTTRTFRRFRLVLLRAHELMVDDRVERDYRLELAAAIGSWDKLVDARSVSEDSAERGRQARAIVQRQMRELVDEIEAKL